MKFNDISLYTIIESNKKVSLKIFVNSFYKKLDN